MLCLLDKYLKPGIINMFKEVKWKIFQWANRWESQEMETIKNINKNSRAEKYNRKKLEVKQNSRLEMIEDNQWTWDYINRNDLIWKTIKENWRHLNRTLKTGGIIPSCPTYV